MNKKAIGILGGMGPLATADLFQKVVMMTKASCDNDHIRIYIDDNAQIPDRTAAILHGGASPLPFMADSVKKLEACGADCIIMPCNTAHYFLPELKKLTKLPFISILEATAEHCKAAFPGKTACILGTTATLGMRLYDDTFEKYGLACISPDEADRERLMRVIFSVKGGVPLEQLRADFETVLKNGKAAGADYFVLGCTELPIVAQGLAINESFADPSAELAAASIRFCDYETI